MPLHRSHVESPREVRRSQIESFVLLVTCVSVSFIPGSNLELSDSGGPPSELTRACPAEAIIIQGPAFELLVSLSPGCTWKPTRILFLATSEAAHKA